MITQCPSCQTRFRLPLDQVATSRGEVLCGECRAQFNALDYLVIEEGLNPGKPTLTMRATEGDERENRNTLFLPIDEEVIANLLADSSTSEMTDGGDRVDSSHYPENSGSPQLIPITQSAASSVTDTLLQQTLQSAVDDEMGEGNDIKAAKKPEPKQEPETEPESTSAPKPEPEPEPEPAVTPVQEGMAETSPAPTTKYQLPQGVADSPDHSPAGPGSLILSTVIVVLLISTLGLQYLLVQREHFSQHRYIRPILTAVCPTLGCSVAPRRDLSRLSIVDNRIETHPRYADALLITAQLSNLGSFEQNYPDIELVMTNIQQEVVASRRFYPDEYLASEGVTRFAANSSNPLQLEVVDPGSHATGFEFILHNSKFPK